MKQVKLEDLEVYRQIFDIITKKFWKEENGNGYFKRAARDDGVGAQTQTGTSRARARGGGAAAANGFSQKADFLKKAKDPEEIEKEEQAAAEKAVTKEEFQGEWTASAPEFTTSQPEVADWSEGMQLPSVPIQQFPTEEWSTQPSTEDRNYKRNKENKTKRKLKALYFKNEIKAFHL
ncbi:hypothetical protein HPG69_017592 [Diceros bicornis minor]|uniref:Small ribosomal subunit protein uS2 C-terminal domain-containing protein n=1 Tax=Diceros bicornis minor TaxID=77932 RepID=A0A7J7EKT8_DICBM|nr:hypothetical protein HPG69_017592 [Diceros bicornis minor]